MTVRQRHGRRIVIVTVAADAVDALLGDAPEELITASRREDIDDETWSVLDDSERLALEAHWLRQSDEYRLEKERRPGQGNSWGHPDFTRPDPPGGVDLEAGVAAGLNDRLRGSVALGLVIVSGPGDLAFSSYQAMKVLAEVQSGLSWLGSQFQLTDATFEIDTHIITIPTPADPDAPDLEAVWRDPAMVDLGYGGAGGVTDYARALKAAKSTDSAYVSFFTHYPLWHFAYAKPWIPETVMQYENDNWGPSNIDSVFAHETGHIFGAPDEYPESNCACAGSWGYYGLPNLNCAKCSAGVRCIMNGNSWTMCAWTPRHIGAPQWWVAGDNYTASTPFVVDDVIYFRGTNDKLYRVSNKGSDGKWLGDSYTASTPFVTDGVIYFQGTNDKLYRINIDGTGGKWLGDSSTASAPFVVGGVIYFRGTNDKLYRMNTDGTGGKWIGDNYTSSTPFVTGGVIYFRGTNDKLYRVNTDGTGGKWLGDSFTSSTPFVAKDVIYFQGTNDKLYRINTDGTGGQWLGDGYSKSSPFISGDVVYFQNDDDELWMINLT
ncbi:MAG TPA: DUF5050 domain-containing protein [Actinokineospora sp.]|nr:DUF5050 domain-containing protein [Actinokineospora sp.]